MKALIDGDILRYSCGFSAERSIYILKYYKKDGKGKSLSFSYRREMDKFIKDNNISSHVFTRGIEIGPVEHALSNCRSLINKILKETNSKTYQIYLTGKGNYRDKVATIRKYKGNRDKSHKPIHYDELTKYMMEIHGAVLVEGKEADDQMGIDQYKDGVGKSIQELETCICSIDKDMNMIPGWHYNWMKNSLYLVNTDDAILWFYCQMIMGDKVDNIVGIPGKGLVAAYKILKDTTTEEEMYLAVRGAYEDSGNLNQLEENALLLWIQREENKRWIAPKVES